MVFKHTDLDEFHLEVGAPLVNFLFADFTVAYQVAFVPNNDNIFQRKLIVVCVQVDPFVQVKEAVLIGYIENEDAAMRPAIIGRSNCAETLLPRRVPELKFDF